MAIGGFGGAELVGGLAQSILGGLASYYSAKGAKASAELERDILKSNARMALINARINEKTAQGILQASEINQGQVSLKAGKVKASQKASAAARGVQVGVGNTAEEIATTDIMKDLDRLQINADSVRKAGAARMQAVNAENESRNLESSAAMASARAQGINPRLAGLTTMLDGASAVATSWYKRTQMPKEDDWLKMMPTGSAVTPIGAPSSGGRAGYFDSPYGRYA